MNPQILSFGLFLLWAAVAATFLLIGPIFLPEQLPLNWKNQMLGYGAAALTVWNLVRWWGMRAAAKSRRLQEEMAEEYRRRTNPPEKEKPVLHPEFKFDDDTPPPPNGTAHR
jgi:hypothetical protein